MTRSGPNPPTVGELRPTQVITQHGPGAIVDLPELSIIIAGLDKWRASGADLVNEPRLEAFLRASALYRPPQKSNDDLGGIPAYVFPEWLVCPFDTCRLLAPNQEFQWVPPPVGEYRCTRTDRHGDKVAAFPARFMIACPNGHLDDFPWSRWVHDGNGGRCRGPLRLDDVGRSGSVNDLVVRCKACSIRRSLGGVFEADVRLECTGRRPWFGSDDYEASCDEKPRVILRGASNAYFAVVASALSIPPYSERIQMDMAPFLEILRKLDTVDKIKKVADPDLGLLGDLLTRHSPEKVLAAVSCDVGEVNQLRPDEYMAFMNPPELARRPDEFEVRHVGVPSGMEASKLATVAAATRLREVRALRGFTRIESGIDIGELADVAELKVNMAPLGPEYIKWRPAVELRGEGVFIALDQQAVHAWESRPEVVKRAGELTTKFSKYKADRSTNASQLQPFPGMRYVLLHSLAHALIRHLCLNAGYSSSALRERIYSQTGNDPMAGLLIYTASSDSEGSLGGLVDQASPDRFGPVLLDALRNCELCTQDPLCGAGELEGAAGLNGAACHACLLLAETSCEASNRFLDRAVLVETLGSFGRWYFRGT